jgi:hypothetical protein
MTSLASLVLFTFSIVFYIIITLSSHIWRRKYPYYNTTRLLIIENFSHHNFLSNSPHFWVLDDHKACERYGQRNRSHCSENPVAAMKCVVMVEPGDEALYCILYKQCLWHTTINNKICIVLTV